MAEKTHDPTPKRIRDARARGDVPRAPLIAGAVGLIALVPLGRATIHRLTLNTARSLMDLQPMTSIDAWSVALAVISAVAPVALVLIAIAIAASVAQGAVTFSPSRLAVDPSKLVRSPFDKSQAWNAFRGLFLAVLLALVLGRVVWSAIVRGAPPDEIAARVLLIGGAVAVGAAVIDAIVGRRIWFSRLRMTREEIVREHKEGEGDPEVKRRREELHHELLAAEALSAVRDATVIVINPTHLACALRYDDADDDAAPTLVAKGHGALAARMIEEAKLHGVPVIQDVPVARALYELETGVEIPEALYEAVAEVLRAAWEEPRA